MCEQDPNTGFFLPYVNWVSRTDSMNQRYIYECLQIVPDPFAKDDQPLADSIQILVDLVLQ